MQHMENRPGVYGLNPLVSPSEFWQKIVGEFDPVEAKQDLQDMLGAWVCSEDADRGNRHRENVWFHYTKLLEILNYYEYHYRQRFGKVERTVDGTDRKDEVLEQLLQRLDRLTEPELTVLLRLVNSDRLTELDA